MEECPLVLERLSEAVWNKVRTGKWEGLGEKTGGGKGTDGTFREWGSSKGEII